MIDQQLKWVWAAMVQRCTNPKNKDYKDYGGRGITVCERWRHYRNFAKDVGPRPAGKSIDRRDNNGNYDPLNYRWADAKTQSSNRRHCIYVMDGEERITLREYCRRHALTYRPVVKRIRDYGWSIDDALSIPVGGAPARVINKLRSVA